MKLPWARPSAKWSIPRNSRGRSAIFTHHPTETCFDEIALRDGRIFDRYTAPVIDTSGVNHGRVLFFRDITQRRRAEVTAEAAQRRLVEASRHAGRAEVASNVLHNVGNVLNTVNIAAEQIATLLQGVGVEHLARVASLLREHEGDLGRFLTTDEQGARLPEFVSLLAHSLAEEHTAALVEVALLRKCIDHIRQVIAAQQDHARPRGPVEVVQLAGMVEDALRINAAALTRHGVRIVCEFQEVPPVAADQHEVLQVLINLIRNAKEALDEIAAEEKRLTLGLSMAGSRTVRLTVTDNGAGIPEENLPRLFEHGFTTRAHGHGFGLHSAWLLVHELGGTLTARSEGPGCGATFTLDLPVHSAV